MLEVLASGVSLEGKELLQKAMIKAFGEGTVSLVELNKDNLRQRVRLSSRNVGTVLVVLDGTSTDICRDIENGLYSSEKYYNYTDDTSLCSFLNAKYSLELEVSAQEDMIVDAVEDVSEEKVSKYLAQIEDKDLLIKNLTARIKELNGIIEEGGYESNSAELDSLKEENISLRNKLLDSSSTHTSCQEELERIKLERDSLKESLSKVEEKRKSLLKDLDSINAELTDYRVKYSDQSALLQLKEEEISSLKAAVTDSAELKARVKLLEGEKKVAESHAVDLEVSVASLRDDLSSASSEIERLKTQAGNSFSNEEREELKSRVSSLRETNEKLSKELNSLKDSSSSIETDLKSLREERDSYKSRVDTLNDKVKTLDSDLIKSNKQNIELTGRLSMLEKSTSRDTDIESLISEVSEVRSKYDSLAKGVFGLIGSNALPKNSNSISLIKGRELQLSKIRFVFAGSTESRKGTYKCLLDEFKVLNSSEKVLIVDAVSETSIDYVFGIRKMISGLDWFRKGGGVQSFLSSTMLKNVMVLSPGLGYLNDTYFLTVDWYNRLQELDNSGYNVVLMLGDISSIVGRVMHESFAGLSQSLIYVHGNAVGSRTVLSNLKGISNASKSIVCYYEFNSQMRKFYDIVSKTCECRVLSARG